MVICLTIGSNLSSYSVPLVEAVIPERKANAIALFTVLKSSVGAARGNSTLLVVPRLLDEVKLEGGFLEV